MSTDFLSDTTAQHGIPQRLAAAVVGRDNSQKKTVDLCAELEATLLNYLNLYNNHIPQRALDA